MIELTKRLNACASLIRKDALLADIGTDHALLPCSLAERGHIAGAIAADVNEKPLERARQTIEKAGVSHMVTALQSNGLEQIPPDQADDIVIAGMGGELIVEILTDCAWSRDDKKHFILQPMSNADFLRKKLCAHGFEIQKEIPVYENGHFYTVMLCVYSGTPFPCDAAFALTGKVPACQSPLRQDYLMHQAVRMEKIAAGLSRSVKRRDEAEYYRQLSKKIRNFI